MWQFKNGSDAKGAFIACNADECGVFGQRNYKRLAGNTFGCCEILACKFYVLLWGYVSKLFFCAQPHFTAKLDAELRLLINVAVIYCSVVQSGSTFGQNLLSIRYDNISHTKKILYLLSGFLSYIKVKIELLSPGHQVNDLLFKIDAFYKVFHLLNLTWFLRDGAQPRVVERFLGLDQVYTHEGAQRQFGSKYLGRELLWNGFIVCFFTTKFHPF